MASKNNPKGRKNDIVIQELEGELLIYDLLINKAYCLNQTATLVWQLCDGNKSISDISTQLTNKLKQPVTGDFVFLAIDQFKKDNLLDNAQEIKTEFDGLSRRQIIRKVGFASVIALPVISSLVAPTAVDAQSACSCTSPGQCGTQTTCPSTVNCNPSGQCAP